MQIVNITSNSCVVFDRQETFTKLTTYLNTPDSRDRFLSECADCEGFANVLAGWGEHPITVQGSTEA